MVPLLHGCTKGRDSQSSPELSFLGISVMKRLLLPINIILRRSYPLKEKKKIKTVLMAGLRAGLRDGQDSHEDGIGPGIRSDVMGSSGGLPSNVIATTPFSLHSTPLPPASPPRDQ